MRQERRRAWWAEPAIYSMRQLHSEVGMSLALVQQRIQALEDETHSRFKETQRTLMNRIADLDASIFDKLKEHRHQLDTIEGDIQKSEEATGRTLLNIVNRIENRFSGGEDHARRLAADINKASMQIHEVLVAVDGMLASLTAEGRLILTKLTSVGAEVHEQVRFDVVKSDIQRQTEYLTEIMKGHGQVSYDLVGRALSVVDQEQAALDQKLLNHVNNLAARLEGLEEQVHGIRSRYRWVEDRYADLSKGVTPREFDYEKRQ